MTKRKDPSTFLRKGRPPGSRNKRTLDAKGLAERLGVDPLEVLLRFANADWKGLGYDSPTHTKVTLTGVEVEVLCIDPDNRRKAAADAAPYIYPKLKNIEHSGPGGGPIETNTHILGKVAALDDNALEKELRRLEKSRK